MSYYVRFPPGLMKDEAYERAFYRRQLLSALGSRTLQLWMQQTLRQMHKSPYLQEGEWERMLAAYEACFPGAER